MDNLLSTPAYSVLKLPNDAVCLQFYEEPTQFLDEKNQEIIKQAKKHVGEDLFFDISNLEKETRAPYIDTHEITI